MWTYPLGWIMSSFLRQSYDMVVPRVLFKIFRYQPALRRDHRTLAYGGNSFFRLPMATPGLHNGEIPT